jgi:ABC-2 type transport system permease protein
MIPALKAEFRKLFSTRSTYVIMLVVALLVVFFAFYVNGWKASGSNLHDPLFLSGDITGAIGVVSIFPALAAILLITQEYRYNLMAYTLTAANNRNKVMGAKLIVSSIFGLVFTLVIGIATPLFSVWGANAHGLHFSPQVIDHGKLLWECLFYGWGYTVAGLLFGALIRNQIGAIIVLFVAPDTVEALLSLLLKHDSIYMPFTALSYVIGQQMHVIQGATMSPGKAAFVFIIYLIIGWAVAWTLFLRRDAN